VHIWGRSSGHCVKLDASSVMGSGACVVLHAPIQSSKVAAIDSRSTLIPLFIFELTQYCQIQYRSSQIA
jgi:hypothetical protein